LQGFRGQSPLALPEEGRVSKGQRPLAPAAEAIKGDGYVVVVCVRVGAVRRHYRRPF